MDKKTIIAVLAGVVIGAVLAPQLAKIPGFNRLPTV
jgi:hypothetical protein